MKVSNKTESSVRLAGLLALGLVAAGWLSASSPAAAAERQKAARVPLPVTKTYQGEQCVEPTEVMRRNHMKFILHQRDETMHRGIRTTKHSLKECVNCHADPKTGSVLGQDGFCASCHQYAAVTIDCFSCHTDKAEKTPVASAAFRGAAFVEQLARRPVSAVMEGAR